MNVRVKYIDRQSSNSYYMVLDDSAVDPHIRWAWDPTIPDFVPLVYLIDCIRYFCSLRVQDGDHLAHVIIILEDGTEIPIEFFV